MRLTWFLAFCMVLGVAGSVVAAGDPPDLEKKASYILGYDMAKRIGRDGFVTIEDFRRGFEDALGGKEPSIAKEEVEPVMRAFQKKVRAAMMAKRQEMMAKRAAEDKKAAAENLQAGKAFLEENGKKPDIKTTASGLQYKVVQEGSGPKPKATDRVRVHYRGTLIDGKEFDSSHRRNQPFTFSLSGGVIQGWLEGVRLMNVGAKYRFFVPSHLAYGSQRMGPIIGPNSTLLFDVELLGIEAAGQQPLKLNFGGARKPLKLNFGGKKEPAQLKFGK